MAVVVASSFPHCKTLKTQRIAIKSFSLYFKPMKVTPEHNARIANMVFANIYPLYLNRLVKNGRTKEELNQVIMWLTGYSEAELQKYIDDEVTYEAFFKNAKLHPNAHLIKGVVCGYRIEEIENKTTQQSRMMEKLIDELARGRKMEKVLRAG